MPDGGTITITTENIEIDEVTARALSLAPGQYVRLCVRDEGTGRATQRRMSAFYPKRTGRFEEIAKLD